MIDVDQFRQYIIKPVLDYLDLYSQSAENLLVGTALAESGLSYLKQINGPALGIYQCEPNTHSDIWDNYIAYKKYLAYRVRSLASERFQEDRDSELQGNLFYATAICRVHYLRVREPLPDADDLIGLAGYWKKHYNTEKGKGAIEHFYMNYL